MALEEYRRKRNFKVTSEPAPKRGKRNKEPIFVIQEHHATRQHWDLRLEAEGVLKSWAVTKEPTMDRSIRRLAIETEDHPMDYATFSGDIPEGQYGAGHVEVWDHGTYENIMASKADPMSVAEGMEKGHIEVRLHGEKLTGSYALVRTDGEGPKSKWLMIRMKEEGEESEPAPQKPEETEAKQETGRQKRPSAVRAADKPAKTRALVERTGHAPAEVPTTNESKVMFPEVGVTKGDVLAYYERIAPLMLPHLKDRPITIERLPDGLGPGKPMFWQKNTPGFYPLWIPRVELETEDGKSVEYTIVNDVATLKYLVNQGAIAFHVWMSRLRDLDRPDYVLFDLDPGERDFDDVITVARELHKVLDEHSVKSSVKTSGKSGLHVIVPWNKGDYDAGREWAVGIAAELVGRLPELATTERSKIKRKGRLYVDVMQNARGRHAVAPYTLRATPLATVSTPLEWSEVKKGLRPDKFTLRTIFRRLARKK